MSVRVHVSDKNHANNLLRSEIKALKGEVFNALPSRRISHALGIKESFEASGYWWQAKILDHHIHKYQSIYSVATLTPNGGETSP